MHEDIHHTNRQEICVFFNTHLSTVAIRFSTTQYETFTDVFRQQSLKKDSNNK